MRLPLPTTWMRSLGILMLSLMVIALLACNKGGRYEDDDDDGQGFTVSGNILVADNTAVDLDINDDGADIADNDNFGQAQVLSVPVILGGYVNKLGAGASGNNLERGDPSDFYRLTLVGDQSIVLRFHSYPDNALHLYLYDDQRRLVDAVQSTSNLLSLPVAEAGTYYLEVFAASGASNYNLTINLAEFNAPTQAEAGLGSQLRLSAAFLPGEAVVQTTIPQQSMSTIASLGPSIDADPLETADSGPQLIRFAVGDGSQLQHLLRNLNGPSDSGHRDHIDPADDEMLAKWDTLQVIQRLPAQADILSADPNYVRQSLALSPNDLYYPLQWHYPLINLPNAWELTTGSSDVVVAVIDTGVLLQHPDLTGRLVAGYDFISNVATSNDGDGPDDDPNDPGDSLFGDSSFHGTHVSGTIAALSDNTTGVAGAGWNTRIMPLRALGLNGGSSMDLIQALRYAAGLENTTGRRAQPAADIINLSVGGENFSQAEQAAITAARDAGLIIVAAAGNSGDESISYPAGYDGVVSVSAVNNQTELAHYSNFGATVDVTAPGGDLASDVDGDGYLDGVLSTCGEEAGGTDGGVNMVYCFQQGTSMSTPHVAAVAALMKAVDPDMTPAEFDARLIGGLLTRDIGTPGWDPEFGYGLIDAYRSVLSAMESSPTVALFEPATLSFDRTSSDLPLEVTRFGSDALSIISAECLADWCQAAADSVDGDGFGIYRIRVDRTGLADGIYGATLRFETSGGIQSLALRMQVLATPRSGTLAHHYVLLVDPVSKTVLRSAPVDASGAFNLTDVGRGHYHLYAGTDMDNDKRLADAGEAIGAYLSMDDPVLLTVDRNLAGFELSTMFRLALPDTLPGDAGSEGSQIWLRE